MKDNIIQLDDHRPLGHDPLPCDTEAKPEFEYTGQRKTLASYSIMCDPKGWIVLCHVPDTSRYHPWVVWYYNAEDNAYYDGDYHNNEIEARNAFKVRINRLTVH